METNRRNEMKIFGLLVGKALAIFILLISILSFLAPESVLSEVYAFEQHHFFLFCFLSVGAFLLFYRLYLAATDERGHLKRGIHHVKHVMQDKWTQPSSAMRKPSDSQAIDKRDIRRLRFSREDILSCQKARQQRDEELKQALILGNTHKHKVKILFRDFSSWKHVETTVWSVDEKYVILKEGVVLPKAAIFQVVI